MGGGSSDKNLKNFMDENFLHDASEQYISYSVLIKYSNPVPIYAALCSSDHKSTSSSSSAYPTTEINLFPYHCHTNLTTMHPHILIVTLPSQGHINPTLQLAKLLIRAGAHVTFFTSTSAGTRMSKSPNLDGLEFATFSDGYDHGLKQGDDVEKFMSQIERLGSQALIELIMASANEGRPFACLLYGVQIPWVAEVAHSLHIPSALVWTQPAAVFDIYYYYFNGYGELIQNKGDHPSSTIELPGLPLLNNSDLPSFLIPPKGNTYKFALPGFQKHLEMLNCESNPKVLINSFDALESEALGAINKFNLMGIGPLIPSAFLDGKDPSDTSFGGDLFRSSKDYIQWLNSKPKSSVIYVSFGSLFVLSKQQSEEIARGLLDGGRPFLWVIRLEENEEEKTLMGGIQH
ncbi:unnamed protein product, partial [Vitis vinifera]